MISGSPAGILKCQSDFGPNFLGNFELSKLSQINQCLALSDLYTFARRLDFGASLDVGGLVLGGSRRAVASAQCVSTDSYNFETRQPPVSDRGAG